MFQKSVSSICQQFTNELDKVRLSAIAECDKQKARISKATYLYEEALEEGAAAGTAIGNIEELFGISVKK
jgi:hypothetical protein